MKPLSAFLPWVAPHAPSAPDPFLEQCVLESCIEFCERTHVIQSVTTADVVANEPEYFIETPLQQRLVAVLKVTYDDTPLAFIAIRDVSHGAALRAGVDSVVSPDRGTPTAYYQRMPTDTAVYLWPVPDASASAALGVRASYAPVRTATSVDDELFQRWLTPIVAGALARVFETPGYPFTNPALAAYHRQRVELAVASASRLASRGAGLSNLRVVPVQFP